MKVKRIQLLLIILASVLLGAVAAFSVLFVSDKKILLGGFGFSAALLLFLIIQVRELKVGQ